MQGEPDAVVSPLVFLSLVRAGADPDDIVDVMTDCGADGQIANNRRVKIENMCVSLSKLTDDAIGGSVLNLQPLVEGHFFFGEN